MSARFALDWIFYWLRHGACSTYSSLNDFVWNEGKEGGTAECGCFEELYIWPLNCVVVGHRNYWISQAYNPVMHSWGCGLNFELGCGVPT